ncbi:MAG: CPBP family intramembrane glutamic endopeptidase [Terracidiphilus sp.]|jgi:membrane protease YdiL (CAAX protease family)
MTEPVYTGGRLRAYLEFLAAFLYLFFARSLAFRGAQGFAGEAWFSLPGDAWSPLVDQAMLVFLLLVGYAAMGFWLDRQAHPISEQGLPRRSGWPREAGLGLAAGWAIALVCVLPLTVVGGIAISFSPQAASWGWLVADTAFFALAALAEEIAFRGYAFQRFAQAVGPVGAALGFAAIYAILQALLPGASHSSFAVSIVLTLVLSACYLRTRALWVSWGLNFAWKASRALLIGLAISGVTSHSPLVQGDPMGPFWLTGGAFGLDGSWLTFFVLLAALPVVFRLTRDLNYRYNAPVIVPGGIPVDLDAISRAQHEAAMGPAAPSAPTLVQIESTGTKGTREQGK